MENVKEINRIFLVSCDYSALFPISPTPASGHALLLPQQQTQQPAAIQELGQTLLRRKTIIFSSQLSVSAS